MKRILKNIYLGIILILINQQLFGQDSLLVQSIVNKVSGDSIFSKIAVLQKLERFTIQNNTTCADYLRKNLEGSGFDTVYFQYYNKNWLPNIIAVKYGSKYPDSTFVLGAHYDSYTLGAPGADDNASGTSGVIESARVLAGYKFERTIMFVLFSGEELGLIGSAAFVDSALHNRIHFTGMLNMDMIAYFCQGDNLDVDICANYQSQNLKKKYFKSISKYVPELGYKDFKDVQWWGTSDHFRFWRENIPALLLIDEAYRLSNYFNGYIHSPRDTIGISANSKILAERITKSAVATLSEIGKIDIRNSIYLNVSENKLSLNSTINSNGLIHVTSNMQWSAESNQPWLTVSPASGSNNGTLTVATTSENTSSTPRIATVTLTAIGKSKTIIITQQGLIVARVIGLNKTGDYKIYPNPVNNELYITGIKSTKSYLSVFNNLGQLVLSMPISNGKLINVDTIPSGIYLIIIQDTHSVVMGKMIKN